jgi:hypothetical protein
MPTAREVTVAKKKTSRKVKRPRKRRKKKKAHLPLPPNRATGQEWAPSDHRRQSDAEIDNSPEPEEWVNDIMSDLGDPSGMGQIEDFDD